LRPVKRGECNRDSGPLFIAGSLPPISPAPGQERGLLICGARAGYEVVGASKDLGMPAIVVAIMRSCRVDRSGIPPFTAMTDRRRPRRRAQPRGLTQGLGVPDLVQLTVLSCPFYGVIPFSVPTNPSEMAIAGNPWFPSQAEPCILALSAYAYQRGVSLLLAISPKNGLAKKLHT